MGKFYFSVTLCCYRGGGQVLLQCDIVLLQGRWASSTSVCPRVTRVSTTTSSVATGSGSSRATGGWWSGAGCIQGSVLVTSDEFSLIAAGSLMRVITGRAAENACVTTRDAPGGSLHRFAALHLLVYVWTLSS